MSGPHSPLRPGLSVLLVEDDEGDALLVEACLEEAGISPANLIRTRTLAETRRALGRRPACVLLDLGLPDADGLGALLTVVEAAPDTAVIVLTGRHDPSGIDALAIGAQDYLVKDDISADLLDRSIRYAIERKRAQRTTLALREAQLSSAEKARLERGLLPSPLLLDGSVECAAYYQPGRDHAVLGGDFYDVIQVAPDKVRVVIGDVMGHGPDEAALGVHLRVAWRTLVLAGTPDEAILPTLARVLHAESGGHQGFVTVCDVTLDLERAEARMRVAGHPAPLRCQLGRTSYLDVAVGRPLGLESVTGAPSGPPWPETVLELRPGSSLILYTDGLLDAYAAPTDDASLGIDELVEAVTACHGDGRPPATWIPTILGAARTQAVDDTAVVVITTPPPA